MRPSLSSLTLAFAVLAFPIMSRAETPAAPPAPGATATAPAPDAPATPGAPAGQPAPAARKEEEDAHASNLSKIAAAFRSKTALADDAAKLKAANEKLAADLKAAQDELTKLRAENEKLLADWKAIETGLLEPETASAEASGKAAAALTEHTKQKVAAELRAIGQPAASLPAANKPGADVPPPSPAQQRAANRDAYWAQRGAPWAAGDN